MSRPKIPRVRATLASGVRAWNSLSGSIRFATLFLATLFLAIVLLATPSPNSVPRLTTEVILEDCLHGDDRGQQSRLSLRMRMCGKRAVEFAIYTGETPLHNPLPSGDMLGSTLRAFATQLESASKHLQASILAADTSATSILDLNRTVALQLVSWASRPPVPPEPPSLWPKVILFFGSIPSTSSPWTLAAFLEKHKFTLEACAENIDYASRQVHAELSTLDTLREQISAINGSVASDRATLEKQWVWTTSGAHDRKAQLDLLYSMKVQFKSLDAFVADTTTKMGTIAAGLGTLRQELGRLPGREDLQEDKGSMALGNLLREWLLPIQSQITSFVASLEAVSPGYTDNFVRREEDLGRPVIQELREAAVRLEAKAPGVSDKDG